MALLMRMNLFVMLHFLRVISLWSTMQRRLYLYCFLPLRMGYSVIIGVSDKVLLNFWEIFCSRWLELLGRQSLRVEAMMKVLAQRPRDVQLLKFLEG
ncbi:unnamed protein product [Triticum turgidum subsp. durum]|uniref:Uncharacterized protein n=1 Tax=Triticum turgidum subsp. durum TaxID=4567 RepID=A0A9R0SL65_TRITD|nr:unnamed protein product [Triticum turgidum subsp. durum]